MDVTSDLVDGVYTFENVSEQEMSNLVSNAVLEAVKAQTGDENATIDGTTNSPIYYYDLVKYVKGAPKKKNYTYKDMN